MPREEIGEGVRVGDRCANTGPSVSRVTLDDGWEKDTLYYRRRLTLEEAERGDIPKPYGKKDDDYGHEWGAMLKASCAPAPNRT